MRLKIKKPLGGKNSIVRQVIRKPAATLAGTAVMGPYGGALGAGLTGLNANIRNKTAEANRKLSTDEQPIQDELARLAAEEEAKRKALGEAQRQQILGFADETQGRANAFRGTLAKSLSDTGQQFFQRLNPEILEDLNSRGLFTSQTARDQEQTQALADIARENESSLRRFDTDIFGQINDIRGTALSAQLGGDQSALDAALALRKAGIQRRFDQEDASREQSFADMMAKRRSRDQMIASLLGLGGAIGAGFAGRG